MNQLILQTANNGTNPSPTKRLQAACMLFDAKTPVFSETEDGTMAKVGQASFFCPDSGMSRGMWFEA